LDSDAVAVKDGCLSTMMKLIKYDETIVGIGGTVYVFGDQSTRIVLPQHNRFNMFNDWDQEHFQLVECDFLPSSNLLIKKSLLLNVGGFTEIYDYLLEDKDLGLKIVKFGLKNVADRRTVVFHPFKSNQLNLRKSYNFHRNVFLYVSLNLNCLPRIVADRLHSRHRVPGGNKGAVSFVGSRRFAETLVAVSEMLLGAVGLILLTFPLMKIMLDNKDYISKYNSVSTL
jgi:GT2 family glycosyltransferase